MRQDVMLSIRGQQFYGEQEPEVIELVTEGILERTETGWNIRYEESDLTGMQGVTTEFQITDGQVTLERSGKLRSQMIFRLGEPHKSLYRMDFGALMISVCATKIQVDLTETGGTVDLVYGIEIEQNAAGIVDYHLEIKPVN